MASALPRSGTSCEASRDRRVAERAYERMTMDAYFAAVVGNHEHVAGTGEVDMEMI
jgi:hypothetical protein